MSSISSVNGSSYIRQSYGANGRPGNPAQRLEKDLTAFLNDQGVAAEDQQAILSEIKQGFSSASSSGGRPDPSTFKEIVQNVLDGHGLKGSDFTDTLPTPPARPSGVAGRSSGASATSSTADTEEESFIQKLLAILKSQNQSSSSTTSTTIAETYTNESIDLLA